MTILNKALNSKDGQKYILDYILSRRSKNTILSICGGSCSGKTTLSKEIGRLLPECTVIQTDVYSRGIESPRGLDNLDEPASYDLRLLSKHIEQADSGEQIVDYPIYSYEERRRVGAITLPTCDTVLIEGLYAIQDSFRTRIDMAVFVETSEEEMIRRRVERGRGYGVSETDIRRKMESVVLPNYKNNILPQRSKADIVIRS